jgi:methanogenic corrinoid protein MtbC1
MERSGRDSPEPTGWSSRPSGDRDSHAVQDVAPERAGSRQVSLAQTIRTEVVPRLMMAHRILPRAGASSAHAEPLAPLLDSETFVQNLLRDDEHTCERLEQAVRSGEIGIDQACEVVLARAARRLGEFWETDACDFSEVTVAVWRLQQLAMDIGHIEAPPGKVSASRLAQRVLISAMPDSDHTLGVTMVSGAFLRAGWTVSFDPSLPRGALVRAAADDHFDIVGLSASLDDQVDDVASVIISIRNASMNPVLGIMVGGPLFLRNPHLWSAVGADFEAPDANAAVTLAQGFLDTRARRRTTS